MPLTLAKKKESFKWPPRTQRTCGWCSSTQWVKEHFKELGKLPWQKWPSDLLLDLQYCTECVGEYYLIREDFLEENPGKDKKLRSDDVQRLSVFIKQALNSTDTTSCTTLEILDKLENSSSSSPKYFVNDEIKQALDVPIVEILQHPELLFDVNLSTLFQTAVEALIDSCSPPVVLQRLPGVNILLIHPSKKIRKWAEKTVKRKKLYLSDYDHCEWSLQKIIQVSTLNLFDFMPENHNDSFEILPSHLWAQHPSVYFYGLLKLLLSMDQEVISLKLMRASEHKQIPDTLINTMEGDYGKDKVVFWTTFSCLVILLESCSSRIWPMMSHSPFVVLNLIRNHTVYSRALRHHMQHYDTQQSLQDFDLGSQEFSNDSLPRAALTWFETFVLSVLGFGDVAVKCVSATIKILHEYSDACRDFTWKRISYITVEERESVHEIRGLCESSNH